MPPKIATARIARGMSLRRVVRLLAERSGRLEPRERQEAEHHAEEQRRQRGARREAEHRPGEVEPPGAVCESSLTNTTTVTMRISATVHTSTTSSTLVPPRAGSAASSSASARATPTNSTGDQDGWFFQMPSESSSPVPKSRRGRRGHRVEHVGAGEPPARDHPGPRPERRADERVHRPASAGSTGTAGRRCTPRAARRPPR